MAFLRGWVFLALTMALFMGAFLLPVHAHEVCEAKRQEIISYLSKNPLVRAYKRDLAGNLWFVFKDHSARHYMFGVAAGNCWIGEGVAPKGVVYYIHPELQGDPV